MWPSVTWKVRSVSVRPRKNRTFLTRANTAVPKFDAEREYVYQEKLEDRLQWCLLKFEAKVRCQLDALVIGSHLESDAAMADACRIAFHGRLVERAEGDAIGEKIRLYKLKRKVGLVAKLGDPCVSTNGDMGVRDVVGKDLFARETNMAQFVLSLIHI